MSGKEILILGAGELGMAVIRSIAKYRETISELGITVLLRPATIESTDPAKSKQILELRKLNISLLAGDLLNASIFELSVLFRPFHTVIGCTGYGSGQPIQEKIAQAVLDAKVSRYFPWQFGVDYDIIGRGSAQDLFDEQLNVRDMLREQKDTEWVIVSTGIFTSYLFESWFGIVDLEKTVVRALGSWKNAVTVTAPEDIGRLTADIIFNVPKIADQIIYTAGDTITFETLANTVEDILGRKMKRDLWTVPTLRHQLGKDPTDVVRKYHVVFGEGKGVSWSLSKTFNHQKGIRVQDIRT